MEEGSIHKTLEKITDKERAKKALEQGVNAINEYTNMRYPSGAPKFGEGFISNIERQYEMISERSSKFIDTTESDRLVKKAIEGYHEKNKMISAK